MRLTPYLDEKNLFLDSEVIIPLPEAKSYIEKKEIKQKEQRQPGASSFSMEKSSLPENELKEKIKETLTRDSDLTPRLKVFFELLLEENRSYHREEIKKALYDAGIGSDIGQSGRYLSNISQFLTKKSNPHLRQVIEFETGGIQGETKDNYRILLEYRELVKSVIQEKTV